MPICVEVWLSRIIACEFYNLGDTAFKNFRSPPKRTLQQNRHFSTCLAKLMMSVDRARRQMDRSSGHQRSTQADDRETTRPLRSVHQATPPACAAVPPISWPLQRHDITALIFTVCAMAMFWPYRQLILLVVCYYLGLLVLAVQKSSDGGVVYLWVMRCSAWPTPAVVICHSNRRGAGSQDSRLCNGCAMECGVGFRQLRTCRRVREHVPSPDSCSAPNESLFRSRSRAVKYMAKMSMPCRCND